VFLGCCLDRYESLVASVGADGQVLRILVPLRLLAGFDKRCTARELLPWRSVRDDDGNGMGQDGAGMSMGEDDASDRRHGNVARSRSDGGD
jgi:hypothetical protein